MASNNKDIEANQGKGFIVLYRSLLDWEYIDDDAVFSCFIKLIMAVNYQDKKWHNQTVKRGSLICSIDSLSRLIHVKRTTLKRCLKLLTECGAITMEVQPNKYHIITIPNYSKYQDKVSRKTTNSPTNKPTNSPTNKPTNSPTNKPTNRATNKATNRATNTPTNKPTTTKQINKGVCLTDTHTPKEEKQAASPSAPQECGTDEPQEKETPPLTRRELRKYCESKGRSAYDAASLWIKYDGEFPEPHKKQIRDWLKEKGIE